MIIASQSTTAEPIATDGERAVASRARFAAVRRWAMALAFGVVVVGALETLSKTGVISSLIMPAPSVVWGRLSTILTDILTNGPLGVYAYATALAMFISFIISVALGVVLGTLLSEFRIVRAVLYPYVLALNASPRVIFAPMFVIWFGLGMSSRIVMAVTIGMFPVLVGTMAGLARADATTIKLMSAFGATPWQRFRLVSFPSALPFIVAGAETASVLSTVGVIIGEFTAGNGGLGYLVIVAEENFDLPTVFSIVVVVALLGILLNTLVTVIGRRLVFWGRTS